MCRRVLHIIREEAAGDGGKAGNAASDAMDASDGSDDEDNSVRGGAMRAFKAEVIEVIGELIDELESVNAHIVQHALEHVSPSSVVLTSGGSDIVEAFLREANRKRKFQCIVAEGAPGLTGHQMARSVGGEKGVETTAVADRVGVRHDVPRQPGGAERVRRLRQRGDPRARGSSHGGARG